MPTSCVSDGAVAGGSPRTSTRQAKPEYSFELLVTIATRDCFQARRQESSVQPTTCYVSTCQREALGKHYPEDNTK
jgi:hypothetical protein